MIRGNSDQKAEGQSTLHDSGRQTTFLEDLNEVKYYQTLSNPTRDSPFDLSESWRGVCDYYTPLKQSLHNSSAAGWPSIQMDECQNYMDAKHIVSDLVEPGGDFELFGIERFEQAQEDWPLLDTFYAGELKDELLAQSPQSSSCISPIASDGDQPEKVSGNVTIPKPGPSVTAYKYQIRCSVPDCRNRNPFRRPSDLKRH